MEDKNLSEGITLTDNELDTIGEILNISMGAAATAVSSMLDKQVTITTPSIVQEKFSNVDYSEMEPALVVKIKYVEGIIGSNVIMFRKHDMQIILNLLMGNDEPADLDADFEFDEMSMSAACEVMNQMMGASATALSEILGMSVNISTPEATLAESSDQIYQTFDDVAADDQVAVTAFKMMIKDVMDSSFRCYLRTDLVHDIVRRVMGESDPEPAQMEAPVEAPPQMEQPQVPPPPMPMEPPAEQPMTPPSMPPAEQQPAANPAANMPQQPAGVPQQPSGMPQQPMMNGMQQPGMPQQPPGMPQQPMMNGMPQQPSGMPQQPSGMPQQPMMNGMYMQPGMQQPMMNGMYMQPGMQPPMMNGMYGMQPQYAPPAPAPAPQSRPAPNQPAAPQVNVKKAQFPDFNAQNAVGDSLGSQNMSLLMGVPLEVSVVIGKTRKKIKDIMEFGQGTVVELDKQTGAPAEVLVNGQLLAYADVVVIGDNFGIRITEIVGTKDLIDSLNGNL